MSVRKTIRISEDMDKRIKKIMNDSGCVTQNEVIRIALNKGLNVLEKKE